MGNRNQNKTFSEKILKSPKYPDGRGEIFLRGEDNPVYQIQMWIGEERKQLRRSLKTTDYETALIRAEEFINQTHGQVASGVRMFGITLGELVEKYLAYRQEDVDQGEIVQERLGTIRSQLTTLLRIKSKDLKLAELDPDSFLEWRRMRRRDNPNVRKVTLRNEQATINAMFQWSYIRKYQTHIPELRFEKITIKKNEVGRRGMLTLGPDGEYAQLTNYFRTYCSEKDCPDPEIRYRREDVRDYILILANTCLRTGELENMRWGDIRSFEETKDQAGRDITLVKFRVRGETTKKVGREIITRGGEYFRRTRLRRNGVFIENDDFIFPSKNDGKRKWDDRQKTPYWRELMDAIGIPEIDYHGNQGRQLQFYGLRHLAITIRLNDNSIFEVAEMAGTSSTYIHNHYAHQTEEMKKQAALKHSKLEGDIMKNEVVW